MLAAALRRIVRTADKPRFVHVAFANLNFSQSLARLRRSAASWGIRDFRAYTPKHPAVCRAAEENPAIFHQKRGAGYWLWKPYILLDTLDHVPEGTPVIYTDAGMWYIADPAPLAALAKDNDIVLFRNTARGLQSTWTKRDCFVLMDADTPEYWTQPQLDASVQIYRVGPAARRFLEELKAAMRDPRILTDQPNECGLPNFEDFQDHRHDQSVLTILASKHGVVPHECPKSVTGRIRREPAPGAIFEHHRIRNVDPIKDVWWGIQETLGLRRIADRVRRKPQRHKP